MSFPSNLKNPAELTFNVGLLAEVKDLKKGDAAIEERARNELGMIKKGETYIQVVTEKKPSHE